MIAGLSVLQFWTTRHYETDIQTLTVTCYVHLPPQCYASECSQDGDILDRIGEIVRCRLVGYQCHYLQFTFIIKIHGINYFASINEI